MSSNKKGQKFLNLWPLLLIIGWLFLLDYSNLWSMKNVAGFLGILAVVLLMAGLKKFNKNIE
tara:strand:- start:430 stop:615 length:186 start_codon:yes stop_codon:yes gene_type:complete